MTVQTLLNNILPRLKGGAAPTDIFQSVNLVTRVLFNRLWQRDSDLIKEPLELDISSECAYLPERFRGFRGDPYYLDGAEPVILAPLVSAQDRAGNNEAGDPEFYEILGPRIYLFPYPEEESVTLYGRYYREPAEVEELIDDLPFRGMFDHIYAEGVFKVQQFGLACSVEPAFSAIIHAQVDAILPGRMKRVRRATGHYF